MAAADRNNPGALALLSELESHPESFDLFLALRRIECVFRQNARLGEGIHPSDEPVRLAQEPSLAFTSNTLSGVRVRGSIPRVRTRILGLLGPFGPLPLHLTEYAYDRSRNRNDPTFAHFLDLFHHRILSLYYRAWANTEPTVAFDRPQTARFTRYIASLIGMGMPSFLCRDELPDHVRFFFAGRYAAHSRNADGLAALLHSFFRIHTKVQQLVGEWVNVPESCRWRLGGPGVGACLGQKTSLGRRAWVVQGKFRVVLGPLNHQQFTHFLPGAAGLWRMATIIRSYTGDSLTWDVKLVLGEDAGRPWRLGSRMGLGITVWLGRRPDSIIVRAPAMAET
ncbi:MAG TPA: type VI secretion system baseplate subunit TssG [Polyangiaceae bacterium]|nr:type VI secretion system baseplate subunit TssG [Polyangiaceae bacterium]